MDKNLPQSPFSTRLSGSARETELRIRSIFQWKKQRPPLPLLALMLAVALLCGNLVSCRTQDPEGKSSGGENGTAYPLSLTSERSLTLELRSDDAGRDGFCSPLKEILVYEEDDLLQTIDVQALAASDQPVRTYNGESHRVETYPANRLAEETPYLYEGLFCLEESSLGDQAFGDFNFDGYTDFALPAVEFPPHNVTYAYFLFHPDTQEYVFSFLMFAPPQLLPEEKLLVENVRDVQTDQYRYYSFDQEGQLYLVRQETEYLYATLPGSAAPEPYPGPAEAVEALRRVMAGDEPFTMCTSDEWPLPITYHLKEYYLDQLDELFWGDQAVNAYAEQFAVVDLDADGTPEIVVLTNMHIHSEPILILRWQDGNVYGYPEVGRGLEGLKTDGTSYWSNGAFDHGFGRDQYVPDGDGPDLRTQVILGQLLGDLTVKYTLNGRAVSKAEYEAAEAAQDAKPDALWYDFTPNNIAALFSQPTGGQS